MSVPPPTPPGSDSDEAARERAAGVVSGVAAFVAWGVVPMFWKQLQGVPAPELLAHRVIWCFAFAAVLVTWRGRWAEMRAAFGSGRRAGTLALCGALIAANWGVFIWAVNAGHIVETSLGYYLTPLVNALFGVWFLHERLRPGQRAALLLAACGVGWLVVEFGRLPWIALALCGSFACYGLLRKRSHAESLPGLLGETAFMLPVALVFVWGLHRSGVASFGAHLKPTGLMMTSGVVTALPLLWFAHAARRLKLTTLGVLQYLGPTCSFLIGVLVYREPFTARHAVAFGLIWSGLAVFSLDAWRAARRRAAVIPPA